MAKTSIFIYFDNNWKFSDRSFEKHVDGSSSYCLLIFKILTLDERLGLRNKNL